MGTEIIHAKQDLEKSTVNFIRTQLDSALIRQDHFCLSLCGGNTPKPIYSALADLGDELPWKKIILTFGDERTVPPDHEESNYRMVKECLLDRVAIPEENVLRMKGELPPEEAAQDYEDALTAKARYLGAQEFSHDLILLGIGGDGHTASLFPGSAALEVTDRRVVANYVEKFDTHRITFTYPFINSAEAVAFLVGGADKKAVVDEILTGESSYPAGRVQPASGRLFYFLGY